MNNSRRQLIADHFSDVGELSDESGFGSLGGIGTDAHFSARAGTVDQGTTYQVNCDNCGGRNSILIEWTELIVVAHGKLPNNWKYANGRLYPDVGCAHNGCNFLCTVQLTPDEAKRLLNAAVNAGKVKPQQIQAFSQQLAAPQRPGARRLPPGGQQ